MSVLASDIVRYCESKYDCGGYDMPKSWPGDTPPSEVLTILQKNLFKLRGGKKK